jgi:hypothetical protein
MEDNQDLINSLKSIKAAAVDLLGRLKSDNPEEVTTAMEEYSSLVDRSTKPTNTTWRRNNTG